MHAVEFKPFHTLCVWRDVRDNFVCSFSLLHFFIFWLTFYKWVPRLSSQFSLFQPICFQFIKNEPDFCPNFAPLSWAIGESSLLLRRIFPHLFWRLLYSNPQNPPRFRNQILNAADSFCSMEGWKQQIQTGMWDHIKCLFEQQNLFCNLVHLLTEILMICANTYGQCMSLYTKSSPAKKKGKDLEVLWNLILNHWVNPKQLCPAGITSRRNDDFHVLTDRNDDFHVLTDRTFTWKISQCAVSGGSRFGRSRFGRDNSSWNCCSFLPQLTCPWSSLLECPVGQSFHHW